MHLPHKSSHKPEATDLKAYKALIVTTSYARLDTIEEGSSRVLKKGKPTGVYASEMTEPYYYFMDSGMDVNIASIKGGKIPIDKLSLMPIVRTEYDSRYLNDPVLKAITNDSKCIDDINVQDYDIIFLSGGWGAAYDFAQSVILSDKISEAYASKKILAAVCHGPLGFIGAKKPDGSNLVENINITGVTNKQLKELMVGKTPKHPETELRNAKGIYKCESGLIDMFKSHVELNEEHLIVTGQNQKAGLETAQLAAKMLLKKNRSEK